MSRRAITPRRSKIPVALQHRWTRTYAETPYDALPWFSVRASNWVVEVADGPWWPRGGRLLDLGCGAGSNSLYLARRGFKVHGVDLAPGAIEAARERASKAGLSADFRVADVLDLPFPNGHFVGALDIGCFHTLPPRLRGSYARELSRVLRPGAAHALSWIPRENAGERGPPHRPSLEEVARSLEPEFLFLRSEYQESPRTSPENVTFVHALLRRRVVPRPPRR